MAPEQHGTLECQPFTKKALICGFAAMNSTNCWLLVLQLFTVGKKSAYTWMHTVQTCCSKVNFDYSISCYILLLFLYYSLNEHCPSHHHSSLGKQPPVITGPWLLHLSSTFSTQQQKKKKKKKIILLPIESPQEHSIPFLILVCQVQWLGLSASLASPSTSLPLTNLQPTACPHVLNVSCLKDFALASPSA